MDDSAAVSEPMHPKKIDEDPSGPHERRSLWQRMSVVGRGRHRETSRRKTLWDVVTGTAGRMGGSIFSSYCSSSATLYTFEDQDKDLLRGTRITDILRSGGSILGDSGGTEATYLLSKPVERIDVFISHNWSTCQDPKVKALCLHFNWKAAVLSAVLSMIVTSALVCIGSENRWGLPLPQFESWRGVQRNKGPYNLLVCNGVFFIALFRWQDLAARLGYHGSVAFLDKTCIHQTDAVKKRKGISMLAGFLANSSTMLVVYTDEYMKKLWTVYELASFLVLKNQNRLILMPILLPRLILVCTVCSMVCSISEYLQAVVSRSQADKWSHFIGYMIGSFHFLPVTLLLQVWVKELMLVDFHVKSFTFANARCFDENDRPVVQRNIAAFMRDMKLVAQSVSDNQALAVFDHMVRAQLPQHIKASMGRSGIPYKYVAIMFLSDIWQMCDTITGGIRFGSRRRKLIIRLVSGLTTSLAIHPAICAIVYRMIRVTLRFRKHVQKVMILLIACCAVGIGMLCLRIIKQLESNALDEYDWLERNTTTVMCFPWDFAVYISFSGYFFLLTFLLYLPVSIPSRSDEFHLSPTEEPPSPRRPLRTTEVELVNL